MSSSHYPPKVTDQILLDLHIHSIYSVKTGLVRFFWKYDSTCTPEVIVKRAMSMGLRGVSVTDHDSPKGGVETRKYAHTINPDFIVLVGQEISTNDGHMLAYGVEEQVPSHSSAEETIDFIHDRGGIAVASHPFHFNPRLSLRNRVRSLTALDGIEAFNSYNLPRDNKRARMVANELDKPVTGGSDAHIVDMVGNGLTIVPASCLTADDVLNAIRTGKSQAYGRMTGLSTIIRAYLRKIAST